MIRRHPGDRKTTADRSDLNDMPVPLLTKNRKGCARDVHDAEEIRLELGAEVTLRDVLDRVDIRVAGIVHNHVEPSERGGRDGDGRARRAGIAHVERDRAYAVAISGFEIA
jgi:hypothetical protein